MHYYQHHIGDFTRDTAFLTNEESMVYLKLIWLYYDTEMPLPNDIFALSIKTSTRDKVEMLEGILKMFFALEDGAWHHPRCDTEIEQYRLKSEQASRAGKASAQRRLNGRSTDVQPTINHEPLTNNQLNTVPTVLVNGEAVNAPRLPNAPLQDILELYHAKCPTLQRVMMLNETRKRHLASRWREVMVTDKLTRPADGLLIFEQFFERVAASQFLTGRANSRAGRQWKATFDWLILPTNFLKVCEGHYDNGRA